MYFNKALFTKVDHKVAVGPQAVVAYSWLETKETLIGDGNLSPAGCKPLSWYLGNVFLSQGSVMG